MRRLPSMTPGVWTRAVARAALRGWCAPPLVALALVAAAVAAPAAQVAGGPGGKARCVSCHPELKADLAAKGAHKPFAEERCGACHTRHASRWGKLLKAEPRELCLSCHDGPRVGAGGEAHPPYASGDCMRCHDPHATGRPKMLAADVGTLCFECHDRDQIAKGAQHAPVREGRCLDCHEPHESGKPGLLKRGPRELCVSCHPRAAEGGGVHKGYSVAGADCTSCHSPHGSSRAGLVKDSVHEPFGSGDCGACHASGAGGGPLASAGAGLCLRCHEDRAGDFHKGISHVGPGIYCLNCHSPHASDREALRRSGEARLCLGCHTDTARRMDDPKAVHKHPLVDQGRCTACHTPHGSDEPQLFAGGEIALCTSCHERHAQFTHPIGEDTMDPRSKRDISCVTCHNLMGGPAPFALRFDRKKELCLQCHKGY